MSIVTHCERDGWDGNSCRTTSINRYAATYGFPPIYTISCNFICNADLRHVEIIVAPEHCYKTYKKGPETSPFDSSITRLYHSIV